jgi:hypothetical protein
MDAHKLSMASDRQKGSYPSKPYMLVYICLQWPSFNQTPQQVAEERTKHSNRYNRSTLPAEGPAEKSRRPQVAHLTVSAGAPCVSFAVCRDCLSLMSSMTCGSGGSCSTSQRAASQPHKTFHSMRSHQAARHVANNSTALIMAGGSTACPVSSPLLLVSITGTAVSLPWTFPDCRCCSAKLPANTRCQQGKWAQTCLLQMLYPLL